MRAPIVGFIDWTVNLDQPPKMMTDDLVVEYLFLKLRQFAVLARDPAHPFCDKLVFDPKTGKPIYPKTWAMLAQLISAAVLESPDDLREPR
jgi:hypothetical protein